MLISVRQITVQLVHLIAGPITITPAELVVRYGDPASANCHILASDYVSGGWDAPSGHLGFINSTTLQWAIEKLEDMNIQPSCFLALKNNDQCTKKLDVIVYSKYENRDALKRSS